MAKSRSVLINPTALLAVFALTAGHQAVGQEAASERATYPDLASHIYIERNSAGLFSDVGAPLLAALTRTGAPRIVATSGDAIVPALKADRTAIAVMPRQRLIRLSTEDAQAPSLMTATTGVQSCLAIAVAADGPIEGLGDLGLATLAGDAGQVPVLIAAEPGLQHLFQIVIDQYAFRSGIKIAETDIGIGTQAVANGEAAALVFSVAPQARIANAIDPALAERIRFVPVGVGVRAALAERKITESRYVVASSIYSPFSDAITTVCDDIVLTAAHESDFDLAAFKLRRDETPMRASDVLAKSQQRVDDLLGRTSRAMQSLWSLL